MVAKSALNRIHSRPVFCFFARLYFLPKLWRIVVRYIINVDLETRNVYGGSTNCESLNHRNLGRHFDLTVHDFDRGCRNSRAANRPPKRYWDDNGGKGYIVDKLVGKIKALQKSNPEAFPRCCQRCKVSSDILK